MNSSHLHVYTLEQNQKWDEIVKSFYNYDVYYLSGYSDAFYLHGDGEPLLFYYESSDIKAINVVMKRDISNDEHFSDIEKNKYFDFATPYGYGGWLIEGNGPIDLMIKEYCGWCKTNNIISEVIRFHPILSNQEKLKEYYDVVDLGKTVFIDLSSEDIIWNNFDSKNRNVIRKAIKNNVSISHSFTNADFSTFKDIYNQTMDRDNAKNYYYFDDSFYKSIYNCLSDNALIFNASLNNKIIASSIIIFANSMMNYHLSGSLKDYGSFAATNLMLYEAAKWGCNNGYKTFHLGGGVGSKQDSLYSFKKAFNKNDDRQYSIGKLIFNKDVYNNLVSLRQEENLNIHFFPLYRS